MNFYLLSLFGKWINLGILFLMSLFGFEVNEENKDINNVNIDKSINVVANVIEYETIKTYDSSIPSNITKVITEGKNGLAYQNNDDELVILETAIDEVVVVGTGKNGQYTGVITGYGPDCKTCSGLGYVYCQTKDKEDFNLIDDGIYYNDEEYGQVRVLAAATAEFPCGTIVEVDSSNLGQFVGIVMDTGYDMRRHLEEGIYHFDVAFETEEDEAVPKATNMTGTVKFNIQRWGW